MELVFHKAHTLVGTDFSQTMHYLLRKWKNVGCNNNLLDKTESKYAGHNIPSLFLLPLLESTCFVSEKHQKMLDQKLTLTLASKSILGERVI